MSKAKFTYDENGATFFYFILSFLALVLLPTTYHLWPYEIQEKSSLSQCNCNGCQSKRQNLNESDKRKKSRKIFVRSIIVLGWLVFILIAYRCATTQNEYINWDPFEILGVSEGASANDIKKAYRKLSLIHHPDKGSSDPSKFVEITKAYAALTDEEARKNWEQYGNPDGPTFATYGIALPSWIVKKENSFVVLGIYALLFMVALPLSVGTWWYKSVKFGSDKVLLHTTELYYHFIHFTPNMPLKRVIMILASSLEFSKLHNPEIIERPSDNQEVPRLIRDVNLIGIEKNKEKPLCFSYSVKARAILHAHLSRVNLHPTTLEVDRCYIVKKCPYLLQEFIQCTSQLITLALSGRVTNMPTIFTLENAMKLGPSIVQALWDYQSPLLQLPHFTEDTIKHFERKKIKIKTIEQIARMNATERRDLLRNFSDSQYMDIEHVMGLMPTVLIDFRFEVLDDEDPNIITAFSIVTAVVKLKRISVISLQQDQNWEPLVLGTNGSDSSELDWDRKFQEKVVKKQKVYESKSKKSHPVHCPLYPDDKQEYWWVYIVDRKKFALITAPLLVTNLSDTEEVELKFSAPNVGSYCYTIIVRSDSYVDCTISKQAKFEVRPAREYVEIENEISEDEADEDAEEEHSSLEDSDLLTDTDDD